ncbi:hypothetical protein GALMADRAFT_37747, partial [Galerina marginata CBS 339.88]
MTILGIGVDLVHVPRIAALLSRRKPDRFAARILSKEEYAQWQSLGISSDRIQFLAVRWCVKEAAYKAMYPAIQLSWKEITYHSTSTLGQKPFIIYHPLAAENTKKVGRTHVSVSHDGEYVYSSVLVE